MRSTGKRLVYRLVNMSITQRIYLNDCVFIDDGQGAWIEDGNPEDLNARYKFKVRVDDVQSFENLHSLVESMLSEMKGEEHPEQELSEEEIDLKYGYMSEDEREYRMLVDSGLSPVYNPWSGRYYEFRPLDLCTSSDSLRTVFFNQFDAPRINGITEGAYLQGIKCDIQAHLQVTDLGRIYCVCDYANITEEA